MRNRGERRWRATLLTTLALSALAGPAWASLRCWAEVDRTQVAQGGQVVLILNAEGDQNRQPQHQEPRIDGVRVVSGGTSQQFSMDASGQRLSVSATYYLRVERDSDFEIPAVTFNAGGETCATEPIAIAVVTGAVNPDQTGGRQAPPPRTDDAEPMVPSGSGPAAGRPGDPFFVTMTVDDDEVWVGEQVVLVFRYHRRSSSWDRPSYTPPRTEGFWRVDLPPERNYRRSIAGHVYDVTEIRYALFPTQSGEMTIEPAKVTIAGDPFERLFGRRGRGPRNLVTDPIRITVRDLPLPRPGDFSGIVASRLDFTAAVDRDTVPRGEPVGLTLEVGADGFLKSYGGLDLPEPPGLQIHDAAENLREDVTGPRYRAVFRQEKAVVPTREGAMSLPPLSVVYFDTESGDYATSTAPSPLLIVTPSDLPVVGDDPSGFRRTEIARLGRDLAFIHAASGPLRRGSTPLGAQPLWWAILLMPWCLLGFYRVHLRRLDAARRDPEGLRRRTAWPRAQKALQRLAGGGEPEDLARVVVGYVADSTGRPAAGLTAADVLDWATRRGDRAGGEALAAILDACDQARFGGGAVLDVAEAAAEVQALLAASARQRSGAGGAGPAGAALAVLGLAAGLLAAPLQAQDIPPAVAAAPGVDPARLLAEGNQAYIDGDLDTAIDRYREARRQGADDAVLHYNLGNAHARSGELGRAIASYLRAERRDPRDPDVRTNLAWVRSHTRDLELAGGSLPPVIQQLDGLAHTLSLDEWSTVLAVLSWLTAALVAWSWRRGYLATNARRVLILLGAATLVVAVVAGTRWYEEQVRDTAVVIAEEVEVRSGPATSFPVVFRVHDGLTLVMRGEREGWVRIGLGGDWVGWVPAGVLEPVRIQGR